MSGYLTAPWSDFSVAVVGAAAALTGLLFVAVSINIEQILAVGSLAGRPLSTMILFVIPLVVAVLLLLPEQSRTALVSSSSPRACSPAVDCSGSTGRPVEENWNRR
jgi:hypothetical protein